MDTYTLIVKWKHGVEVIDLDMPFKVGETIFTIYTNKSGVYGVPFEYCVSVTNYAKQGSEHKLDLLYEKSKNQNIPDLFGWGTSFIDFNTELCTANVEWKNDSSQPDYSGSGTATLKKESLLEDLGFIKVWRRKRRQAAFRKSLIESDKCCALTGETTEAALEAAHIIDAEDKGGYSNRNGLLLRSDIHRLFDRGLIKIELDGAVTAVQEVYLSENYLSEISRWKLRHNLLNRIRKALETRNAEKVDG